METGKSALLGSAKGRETFLLCLGTASALYEIRLTSSHCMSSYLSCSLQHPPDLLSKCFSFHTSSQLSSKKVMMQSIDSKPVHQGHAQSCLNWEGVYYVQFAERISSLSCCVYLGFYLVILKLHSTFH